MACIGRRTGSGFVSGADLPDDTSEVAIVNAQGQAKGFKVLLPNKAINGVKDFNNYFSWSPDGKQILVPMMMEGDTNLQLYIFDLGRQNSAEKACRPRSIGQVLWFLLVDRTGKKSY